MAATMGDPATDSQVSDAGSAAGKRKLPSPSVSDKAPWFFSLRSSHFSRIDTAIAVQISPKNDGSPAVVAYKEQVPEKYRNHCLVASMGNYIFIKGDADRDRILLVDPFSSSWTLLGHFPRHIPHSITLDFIGKVVVHGGIAVAIAGVAQHRLVYMPLGFSGGWIVRDKMTSWRSFSDVISRNEDGDDLFYALGTRSDKAVAIKFVSASKIRGDDDDFDIQDMTLDLRPGFDPLDEANDGWCCLQFGNLVDSPSGLFIVRWRLLLKRGEQKRRQIDVYKLSPDKKMWVTVSSLDGYSFFLGMNQSLAASLKDFPELTGNLIYIPYDAFFLIDPGYERVRDYMGEVDDNLIYDVQGDCWGRWDWHFGMEDNCREGMIWPGVWMMPPRVVCDNIRCIFFLLLSIVITFIYCEYLFTFVYYKVPAIMHSFR